MLRNCFITLFFFSLVNCNNSTQEEYNPVKLKEETTSKVKSGYFEKKYPNGNLWSSCYYKDGMKHGKVATYYPNGNLRYIGRYKNDKKTDIWLFYHEDGSFAKEIDFSKP